MTLTRQIIALPTTESHTDSKNAVGLSSGSATAYCTVTSGRRQLAISGSHKINVQENTIYKQSLIYDTNIAEIGVRYQGIRNESASGSYMTVRIYDEDNVTASNEIADDSGTGFFGLSGSTFAYSKDLIGLGFVNDDRVFVDFILRCSGSSDQSPLPQSRVDNIQPTWGINELAIAGNLGLNADNKDNVVNIIFNQPDAPGDSQLLQLVDSGDRFVFTTTLQVQGDIYALDGDIYLNVDGGDKDSFLYFYDGGSPTGKHLKWDDANDNFEMNDSLYLPGGSLNAGDNVAINYDGPNGDSFLYFYEGGAVTGARLMWDDDPGTFKFNHPLDMDSNKITSVTDPTAPQDVVTLNHLAGVISGSSHDYTLDDVCENGAITDVPITVSASGSTFSTLTVYDELQAGGNITAANLISNTDVFINYDNSDSNVHIYFGKSPAGAESLTYNSIVGYFVMSDHLNIMGDAYVNDNIYVNFNGGEGDGIIYFYEGGSDTGASLKWDDSEDSFAFSDGLNINGTTRILSTDEDWTDGGWGKALELESSDVLMWKKGASDYSWGMGATLDDNWYFKKSIADDDSDTGTTIMKIEGANNIVSYTGRLRTGSNLSINYDGPEGDGIIYFYEAGSETGANIQWFNGGARFNFTHTVATEADFKAKGNMYINFLGGNEDSFLYFREGGSDTGAWLKWDDDPGSFAFNKGLNVGDGGTTNYTEIKDNGTVRLHGEAETWEDIRIVPGAFEFAGNADPSLQSWQPGGEGITFKIYKFKIADEVFFSVQLPHNYKEGSVLEAHVHWTPADRGNEENGNDVSWRIGYTWANKEDAFSSALTATLTPDTCAGIDDQHEKTLSTALLGATGKTISSMLVCKLWRSSVNDTWVGTTNAQSPGLLEVDFHYQIDSLGSNLERTK